MLQKFATFVLSNFWDLFFKHFKHHFCHELEAILKYSFFGETVKLIAVIHHLVEKLFLLIGQGFYLLGIMHCGVVKQFYEFRSIKYTFLRIDVSVPKFFNNARHWYTTSRRTISSACALQLFISRIQRSWSVALSCSVMPLAWANTSVSSRIFLVASSLISARCAFNLNATKSDVYVPLRCFFKKSSRIWPYFLIG